MNAPQTGTRIGPVKQGPITLEMLKAYAQASGDFNPIHTDESAAKKVGLPGIIAHGMLSAGYLADAAVRFMRAWESDWRLTGFQTRFRAMTFLGDFVQITGSVKSVDGKTICLELTAANSKGEVTTAAFAEYSRRTPL